MDGGTIFIVIVITIFTIMTLSDKSSGGGTGVIYKKCEDCNKWGMDCKCKKVKKSPPPAPIKKR